MARIRCKRCDKILDSKFTHDFQECKCGVFVDGGDDYMRIGWPGGKREDWVEILPKE